MNAFACMPAVLVENAVLGFVEAHLRHATPRSAAYRAGFAAQLAWWMHGAERNIFACFPPHRVGTADADAWWSGWEHSSNQIIRDMCQHTVTKVLMPRASEQVVHYVMDKTA